MRFPVISLLVPGALLLSMAGCEVSGEADVPPPAVGYVVEPGYYYEPEYYDTYHYYHPRVYYYYDGRHYIHRDEVPHGYNVRVRPEYEHHDYDHHHH